MTKKQESQWLYAKGLELAILIKGTAEALPKEPFMYDGFISKNYGALAKKIARNIVISAKELQCEG